MKKKKQHYKPSKKSMMKFSLEYIHDRISKNLPYVYSAIALAMWNLYEGTDEEKHDAIMELIQESGRVWNDIVENEKNVIDECERITGVSIRDEVI